jgi:hypothetical protein
VAAGAERREEGETLQRGGLVNVDSILVSDYAQASLDGKLTVVGVFNRVSGAPITLPQLSISLVIHGHAAEAGTTHTLEIWLLNERREKLNPEPMRESFTFAGSESILPGVPLRVISVSTVLMPTFSESGPYAFEVYIDGTYHASASLYVGSPTA